MTPADRKPPEPGAPTAPAPATPAPTGPIYSLREDGSVTVKDAQGEREVDKYSLPPAVAQQLLPPEALKDYADQKQFGEGIENVVRAGAESGFNQAMLGAGDAIMIAAGANAEALRQRRARNETAAMIGGAGGFILPLALTGGEAAVSRATSELAGEGAAALGTRLGAETAATAARGAAEASTKGLTGALRFTPTPAGAAALGQQVQRFTEAALAARPVAAKLSGVLARNATEGAIYGTGSAISDVVRDGDDALGDHETAAEYIMAHAAQGAGIGLVLGGAIEGTLAAGGKALKGAGRAYESARNAVLREPELGTIASPAAGRAGEAQARAAEAYEAAQRARDEAVRLDLLPEYAAPKSEQEAKKLLTKITAAQSGDEQGARRAVEDTVERVNRIQGAADRLDRTVDETTTNVSAKISEREQLMDRLLGKFSIGRKFTVADKAIRESADVAPIELVAGAGSDFVGRLKTDLAEFSNDPDTKQASIARRLSRFADDADLAIRKATKAEGGRTAQADVFAALDNLKRAVGVARTRMPASAGDVELGNLAGRLQGHYSELAEQLSDPTLYGRRVAALQADNNAAWTQFLDVAGGFEREFLKTGEYGAGKTASGFGALSQADPSRIGSLVAGLTDPKRALQLQVFSQGLDSGTALIEQLARGLRATPEEMAAVKEVRRLTEEIGDHMGSAFQTHADAAEYQALKGNLRAREQAIEAAGREQEKAAELGVVAREKATIAQEDIATRAGAARVAALEQRARGIRAGVGSVAGTVAATALHVAGVPWWTAAPLSAVATQVLAKMSAEKVIAATAAGYRAVDRAAEAVSGLFAGGRMERASAFVAANAARGAVAAGAQRADTRRRQYENIRAELDRIDQDPVGFASSGPLAGSMTPLPMLQASAVQKRATAVKFLRAKLPPEFKPLVPAPQLDRRSHADGVSVRRFMRYAQAVSDPLSVLDDASRGIVTAEGFEALQAVYPKMHAQLVASVLDKLSTAKEQPSMSAAQDLSIVMGVPMHFTMTPEFVRGAQSAYAQAVPTDAALGGENALPASARDIVAKTPGMAATATQSVEGGLGRG